MSWSDAYAKYRWASLVAVSRTIGASRRTARSHIETAEGE